MDRFIASQQMATLVQMLNNLVSFSVLEVMKNAVFTEDGDGNLKMDITKLPQHLQTMSAENIKAEFNTLQSGAQQNITLAEQGQSQIAAYSQQNMMSGALSAALADEGMMEKVGGGVGSVARGLMGLR
jgi:Tfp pilus assembly protein FimT